MGQPLTNYVDHPVITVTIDKKSYFVAKKVVYMVLILSAGLFIFVALLGLIDSFLGLNFDFSE